MMRKEEIIEKMKGLETDVAGITSSFLIAIDDSQPKEFRKMFSEKYQKQLPLLLKFNNYDEETVELYLQAKNLISEINYGWEKIGRE